MTAAPLTERALLADDMLLACEMARKYMRMHEVVTPPAPEMEAHALGALVRVAQEAHRLKNAIPDAKGPS